MLLMSTLPGLAQEELQNDKNHPDQADKHLDNLSSSSQDRTSDQSDSDSGVDEDVVIVSDNIFALLEDTEHQGDDDDVLDEIVLEEEKDLTQKPKKKVRGRMQAREHKVLNKKLFVKDHLEDDYGVLDEIVLVDLEEEEKDHKIKSKEKKTGKNNGRKRINESGKLSVKNGFDKVENSVTSDNKRKQLSNEEELEFAQTCRKRLCFVKMFSFKTDYGEDEEIVEDSEVEDQDENKTSEADEITLGDSPIKKRQERPRRATKTRRTATPKAKPKPKTEAKAELSDYEKIRADNIAEREAMLASLGIHEEVRQLKQGLGLGGGAARRSRGEQEEQGERRRSARIGDKEDRDWTPGYREKEEEDLEDQGDHTHQGLRRHPCKECDNCLVKDCRRCVFCRDKAKYGGPNIKKQRCERKERCLRPQVVCTVCKGGTKHACDKCERLFQDNYDLKEHKREVHGEVQEQEEQEERPARRTSLRGVQPIVYREDDE